MKTNTIASQGLINTPVSVETHVSRGLPATIVVGLAHRSVIEAKDRLRSAFAASGVIYPRKRVTINLIPADVPKTGASLDLAMAVSILRASEQLPLTINSHDAFIGEVSLDGDILPVKGIVGKLMAGKAAGINRYFLSAGNLNQAQLVPGVTLIPLICLRDLLNHAHGITMLTPLKGSASGISSNLQQPEQLLSNIRGLEGAKRALRIAAAGRHNILITGPPGVGKSMLAHALASLLPPPTHDELLTITHLHSLGHSSNDTIMHTRPTLSPHHTATTRELLGSATFPGAVSLAHHGVLLLDELPEFARSTIEALRQPLENHYINHGNVRMPANFLLVATANPCPCGNYGSLKTCSCAPYQIQRYQAKLSGPFIDRIDLHLSINSVEHQSLLSENHQSIIEYESIPGVQAAESLQFARYSSATHNGHATAQHLSQKAAISSEARLLLDRAATKFNLSARGYIRTVGVARTIADLDGNTTILSEHIAEALQYRPQSNDNST